MTASSANSSTFGVLAEVMGFLAFVAIVGHFFVGPFDPPPPKTLDDYLTCSFLALAMLAILMSVIGFISCSSCFYRPSLTSWILVFRHKRSQSIISPNHGT